RRRTTAEQRAKVSPAGTAAETPARQTEPAVDPIPEEIGSNNPVRGHASLRVADEPERFDVLLSELVVHESDDVLEVLVVSGRPNGRRRIGRGNDQPVLVLVVDDREVVPLPVAVRATTVQAQHERDLFVALQIAWVIEKEPATCF